MNNFKHCFFVSDIHGDKTRYHALFNEIEKKIPDCVLIGGDVFPHRYDLKGSAENNFLHTFLIPELSRLKEKLQNRFPRIFLILGNDDARLYEQQIVEIEKKTNLWHYIHNKKVEIGNFNIFGYSFIPPTPFALKDWEKYDVSRFVDPGCMHPSEGFRTVEPDFDLEYSNIKTDLENLTKDENLSRSIFLFHSPPYNTPLDRAALDGKMIDYVPLDVHVGSIAIQRFIEARQPLLTLHGHVHETTRLTGKWQTLIGKTYAFSAAYAQNALSIVEFDPNSPESAERTIIG